MPEHDTELSTQQMASALTEIRENPERYGVSIEYKQGTQKGRWQVFKGVFANVE